MITRCLGFILLFFLLSLNGCTGFKVPAGIENLSSLEVNTCPAITPITGKLAQGESHTCALIDQTVYCWGNNLFGQAGLCVQGGGCADPAGSRPLPSPVLEAPASHIVQVVAGANHTCALSDDGKVFCWGMDTNGRTGRAPWSASAQVLGLPSGIVALSAGVAHTCAATTTEVFCWGASDLGQLGDGTKVDRGTPHKVPLPESVITTLAAGGYQTCVGLNRERVLCWGDNQFYQIDAARGSEILSPVEVPGLPSGTVSAIYPSTDQMCVLIQGQLWCLGYDLGLSLGVPIAKNPLPGKFAGNYYAPPAMVRTLPGCVQAASIYSQHVCAASNGQVFCWGRNEEGQVGTPLVSLVSVPTLVSGIPGNFLGLVTGLSSTCAATTTGLYCWGQRDYPEQSSWNTVSTTPVSTSPPLGLVWKF